MTQPPAPERPWLDALGDAFLLDVHEEALRADPADEEAMEFLAHAYTRCGRIAEGLALDRALARRRPADPVVRYNLACSLALAGAAEEALEELRGAVALGYDDPAHAAADPDLASLRGDPRFDRILGLPPSAE